MSLPCNGTYNSNNNNNNGDARNTRVFSVGEIDRNEKHEYVYTFRLRLKRAHAEHRPKRRRPRATDIARVVVAVVKTRSASLLRRRRRLKRIIRSIVRTQATPAAAAAITKYRDGDHRRTRACRYQQFITIFSHRNMDTS